MRTHRLNKIKRADGFWIRLFGLMGKTRWPANYDGLWFPRCRGLHTAFTFLRPDLIFLKDDGTVVSIFKKAGPWRIWVDFSARQCLEIRSGFADRRSVRVGDRLLENGLG